MLRRRAVSFLQLVLDSNKIGLNKEFKRYKQIGSGMFNRGQHRGRKQQEFVEVKQSKSEDDFENNNESSDFIQNLTHDLEYESLVNTTLHVSNRQSEHQIFLIQPYVKWGPRKRNIKPEHQLAEAEALIRSIPQWSVVNSVKIGMDSMEKRTVFGPGQLEQLKMTISKLKNTEKKISAVFVSKSMLTQQQKLNLEMEFGRPVFDRYSIVIQILRLHAISSEAKLQVAMAEIPYIWTQVRDIDGIGKSPVFVTDAQKEMLKTREKRIKHELQRIRSQRMLLRRKRISKNFPIVAVVGYTNAGKTSLIKALTKETSMQPKDQLFATLDVTAHAGLLPCKLNAIFMDTVGFMSDIPTDLIECFVATLEDAMLADVILHVQDISHENVEEQKNHVETTLKQLLNSITKKQEVKNLPLIINVGNKLDLYQGDMSDFEDLHLVSSKTLSGIQNLLQTLENAILMTTNRLKMVIKVKCGGEESAWLFKNTAVTETVADPESAEHILMHVVITKVTLEQFKHKFIMNYKSN